MRLLLLVFVLGACSRSVATDPASAPGGSEPVPIVTIPPSDAAMLDAATLDALAPDALAPDAASVAIVDAPMAWSAERERLTLAYRRAHSDPEARDLTIEPRVIVLHYTGGGSARGTRRYFDRPEIEPARAALRRAGRVNVSAHYVIDRDGTIYQLQPETRFARHCIGLNHIAIGIENVGDGRRYPLTDAQVAANAALVRSLVREHAITHLLGHHEVMQFREHPYYVELERGYSNRKPDPGPAFMARVRELVSDLGLQGP